MSSDVPTVSFHYIKSGQFRVAHVDGAIGNLTPGGLIFVALYSERAAIPQMMVHEITEGGEIGPEHQEERLGKKGIVREIEMGAVMSVETANAFIRWLQQQVGLLEKLRKSAEQERGQDAPLH